MLNKFKRKQKQCLCRKEVCGRSITPSRNEIGLALISLITDDCYLGQGISVSDCFCVRLLFKLLMSKKI